MVPTGDPLGEKPIPPAPLRDCPVCGRRMQHIKSTQTTHHYMCNAHTLQNSRTNDPYYYNDHYRLPVDEDGKIQVMSTVGRRRMSGKV